MLSRTSIYRLVFMPTSTRSRVMVILSLTSKPYLCNTKGGMPSLNAPVINTTGALRSVLWEGWMTSSFLMRLTAIPWVSQAAKRPVDLLCTGSARIALGSPLVYVRMDTAQLAPRFAPYLVCPSLGAEEGHCHQRCRKSESVS
jgi:hypothetical protein